MFIDLMSAFHTPPHCTLSYLDIYISQKIRPLCSWFWRPISNQPAVWIYKLFDLKIQIYYTHFSFTFCWSCQIHFFLNTVTAAVWIGKRKVAWDKFQSLRYIFGILFRKLFWKLLQELSQLITTTESTETRCQLPGRMFSTFT